MKKSRMAIALAVVAFVQVGCSKGDESSKPVVSEASSASNATSTPSQLAKPPAPPAKNYEGPLGLAMGISTGELVDRFTFKVGDESKPHFYTGTPPKPAPGFGSYFVVATKEQGVCKIMALADVNVVNASGDQIKSETDRIAEMVELKYGKPTKKYDFASQDVYRRNPQFFMMALKEDAVTYAYDWTVKPNSAGLSNDLAEIEVMAMASRIDSGIVRLQYTFTNFNACAEVIKKQKSANL